MKRKSRPLITGGLLGLAGLGLLPSRAEAAPDNLAIVPDPSLGTDLTVDPHSMVVPEPSAQTTAPQIDDQGMPQPAWTPEGDHPVVAAAIAAQQPATAAAAIIPQPESSAPATAVEESRVSELSTAAVVTAPVAVPEAAAIAPAAAPNPAVVSLEPSANTLADLPVVPAPEPAVIQAEVAEVAETIESDQAAIAGPPIGVSATPIVAENVAASTEAAPTVTPAKTLAAISAKPAASRPAQALQLPEIEPRSAIPTAIAPPVVSKPLLQPAQRPAAAIAGAVTRPALNAAASPRPNLQAPPDVTALRARAASVRSLLHNLRSAYGIELQTAIADSPAAAASSVRQTAQSETLSQGPQLPPLPSRSARLSPDPRLAPLAQPQKPGAAASSTPVTPAQNAQPVADRSPQLPVLLGQAPNVALALPTPRPMMSSEPAARTLDILPAAIAQATSPADADQVRDDLQIAPLTTTANPRRTFGPSPNAGIPSGFGANGGDVFASVSLSGADRLRPEADGSLSVGFGLGDSRRVVGVELAYNLLSMRRFGENGGFDAKIHRQVYSSNETEVAAAVGLNNFASYGSEAGGSQSSLYGVVTAAHLLQPDNRFNRMPITGTLGLGGGNFSGEGSDVGVIAGVGLQVHPQFSINTAWSGVGLNVGASIVPVPTMPLTLNLLYGDIGNNTQAGSVAVLSIGYGFNFGPQF